MKILPLICIFLLIPTTHAAFTFEPGWEFRLDNLTALFGDNITIDGWDASTNNSINFTDINLGGNLTHELSLDVNGTVNITFYDIVPNDLLNFTVQNTTANISGNITLGIWEVGEEIQEFINEVFNQTIIIDSGGEILKESFDFSEFVVLRYESIPPFPIIHSPLNTTYNNTKIRFLANASSIFEDVWLYWIERGGTSITNNQSYTENENISIKDFLGINAQYTLFVWVNDTFGNLNLSNVTFTINTTSNIIIEPTSPPSGGGGGYDVDLNFTSDVTAAATVDGYEPFTIRANLFVTDTTVTFDTPLIVFSESNITRGTWNLHYVSGSGNDITYERTVTLPPGVYTYFIEVDGSNGITYFSEIHNINVRVPTDETVTNVTLPASTYTGVLVTFTDHTTPRSHSFINRNDGVYISGLALNVNGTLSDAILFITSDDGRTILSSTNLDFTDNGEGIFSLYGFSALPASVTRISIMLGINDSNDNGAYSVSRRLIILEENPDHVIKTSLFPFLNPFGAERGEGELTIGRMFSATVLMLALIGLLFMSGAGTLPAVAFSVMIAIEYATFNIVPTWISIIGVVLLGMIVMKVTLNMWLRRG